MGADGLGDKIGDLPVDEAPAVPIEEFARSRRKEQALRNSWVASVELVDKSVGCKTGINPDDSCGRRNGSCRREIIDRLALWIARDHDSARSHDLLHRADDRKDPRRCPREVGPAVRTRDGNVRPNTITGRQPARDGTIDDYASHRVRHDVDPRVVGRNLAHLIGQYARIRVNAAASFLTFT